MNNNLKFILKLTGLLILDAVLIGIWIMITKPHDSEPLALLILIPFVFVVNLMIAGIFAAFKLKRYVGLFILNAFMASVVMYYLFPAGSQMYRRQLSDVWMFPKDTVQGSSKLTVLT